MRLGPRAASSDEGPWWSLAPHDISLVRHVLRTEVIAVSASRHDFADGGSQVSARLRLSVGSARLVASTASHQKARRLEIFGDQRSAVFDDGGARPTLTVVEGAARADGAAEIELRDDEPLICEAAHFVSALLDGSRIATDAEEGCRVTAVLEAGDASISSGGRWTRVAAPPANRRLAVSEQDRRHG